jgi:hypothetical protein
MLTQILERPSKDPAWSTSFETFFSLLRDESAEGKVERSRILMVDIVDAAHDLRHLEYRTESTLSPSHSAFSPDLYYSVDQRA